MVSYEDDAEAPEIAALVVAGTVRYAAGCHGRLQHLGSRVVEREARRGEQLLRLALEPSETEVDDLQLGVVVAAREQNVLNLTMKIKKFGFVS